MRQIKVPAAALLSTALLAGCVSENTSTEEQAWVAPTATAPPPVVPPPGWAEDFPGPPDGIPLLQAQIKENGMFDMEEEPAGTVIHRSYWFETGSGRDEEVDEILDHYRTVVTEAGWELEQEVALEPDTSHVEYDTTRLTFRNPEWLPAVTVERRDDVVHTEVSMSETFPERVPYHAHPPLMPMPEWFSTLASDLPADAARESIEVVEDWQEGTKATVLYLVDVPEDGEDGSAVLQSLAEHYRSLLPADGWTIRDDDVETSTTELEDGTRTTERLTIDFEGHGVTGRFSARHSVLSEQGPSDQIRAWVMIPIPPDPDVETS